MSAGLALGALGCAYSGIRTKADAMKFALEGTAEFAENKRVFNTEKALKVYKFFCEHVELVDSDVVPVKDIIEPVLEMVRSLKDNQCKCSEGCGCKCQCKK